MSGEYFVNHDANTIVGPAKRYVVLFDSGSRFAERKRLKSSNLLRTCTWASRKRFGLRCR